MKKLIFVLIITAYSLLHPVGAKAHPGNTASDGCHYCRTNCSSWGEVYGARHCHNGYTAPSVPTTPTCPLHSSYNSLSKNCECNYGYVNSGGSCISEDQSCKNQYGYMAKSNYSGNCECSYGYVMSGGQCVSESTYCSSQFGYNSSYDSLSDKCKCNYGYVVNSNGTSCISEDQACKDDYGYMAKSNYSGNCECLSGYHFEGDDCVMDKIESSYGGTPESVFDFTNMLEEEPSYTPLPEETPKPTTTPTPTPKPTTKPSPTPLIISIDDTQKSTQGGQVAGVTDSEESQKSGEESGGGGGALAGLTTIATAGYFLIKGGNKK